MKKIIYSLVIMIAAGSLFTSCIEQVEPLGIQDLRFAKAEYIRALKDLRAADAEYRRAEAAVQQAIARYEDALTAGVNADTEYQKLLNEYQALVNQDYAGEVAYNEAERLAKLDSLQKAMEVRELNHKRELAEAEKEMRLAQEDLRVTIRNINLACGDLTASEKIAIYEVAAAYYWLTEKSIRYKDSVYQAQLTVDTLKAYKERFSDTAWDPKSMALVNVYEMKKSEIETEQAMIEFWMNQYENMPDTAASIAEWKAALDGIKKEKDKIAVDTVKIDAEKATYETLIKESVRDFDVAVAEWIEENWYTEDGVIFEEPATSAGKKPTEEQYTSTYADSLLVLMIKPEGVNDAVWAKFNYLLGSYTGIDFPFSAVTPKNKIMETGDTTTVLFYQDMDEYILGKAGNKAGSQHYSYEEWYWDGKWKSKTVTIKDADFGLLGVYDILARDLVTTETAAASEAAIKKAKEDMEKAEKKWNDDRNVLIAGFDETNFAPYGDAIKNLKEQIKTNGEGAKKMVDAIVDLKAAIVSTGTNFQNFDGNDSTKLFDALVDFAEARANYLDYTAPTTIDPQKVDKRDRNVFYYSKGKSGGSAAILANAEFKSLSFSALDKGEYNYITDEPGDKWNPDINSKYDSVVNAFANIVAQLDTTPKGSNGLYDMFNWTGDTIVLPNVTNKLVGALYGKYEIDDWAKPTAIYYAGTTKKYKPSDLIKKENAVYDSVAKFIKAYKDFWGMTYGDDVLAKEDSAKVKAYIEKLEDPKATAKQISDAAAAVVKRITDTYTKTDGIHDPLRYSKETFVPYADGSPVVTFTDAAIDGTEALSAILTSVDTAHTPQSYYMDNAVIGHSLIFGEDDATAEHKYTDFYNYQYKAYDYWKKSTSKASEQLAKIRAEIKKVEDALEADKAQAGILDEEAYKKAVAKWEIANAAAEAYAEAKTAFVGIYDYDAKGNPIYNRIFANTGYSAAYEADTCKQGETAYLKTAGVEALFAKNILGLYAGWNEHLDAGQLALAEELFGEEPWEQYNEWELYKAQYRAQIDGLDELATNLEKVFMAKAKLEGLRDAGTSGESATISTVDQLYKAYVDNYNAMLDAIVVFDEFGNVDPNASAKVNDAYHRIDALAHEAACYKSDVPEWDSLISTAENELEVLKNRQKNVDNALKMAKENYDRLREYLLSQDGVSYVIPISTADVDDIIMNLDYVLRTLGHTVVDIYTEVGDKIGA